MQEMLYPTSYLKSMHLGKECALITDGRFSGGTSGLSIGHVSPEAAAGGAIARLRDGDEVVIDADAGELNCLVDEHEWASRTPLASTVATDGVGREMFAGVRQQVTSAEMGASVLFTSEEGRSHE